MARLHPILTRILAFVFIFVAFSFFPDARGSERSESYKAKGDAFYQQKHYDKAIEEFTKAIEEDPDFLAAYYNRGLANYDLHLYYKAIVDFDMVIMLNPDDKDSYFSRGLSYSKVNKLKLALSDMKKAADLGDGDAKAMIASGEINERINKARSRQVKLNAILDEKQQEYNRIVTVVNTDNEFNGNTVCTTHSKGDPLFDGKEGIFKTFDFYNASDALIKTEILHTFEYNSTNNKTKTTIWYNPDTTILKKEFILTGKMLGCKGIEFHDAKGNFARTVIFDKFGKEIKR